MTESNKILRLSVSLTTLFMVWSSIIPTGFGRRDHCPQVSPMKEFNIFQILGQWYVIQYYSSSEEALTYHCMRAEFGLSNGNMDMKMRLFYRYAADPNDELQTGNITWQIPDPRRPEHWRHTEDHYKGVYNTDVVDTDHSSWMILLHCSDPESEKKFLSSFVLSRTPSVDKMTGDYLREKIGHYDVNLDYLFPVNQTFCFGEQSYPIPPPSVPTTTTEKEEVEANAEDLYFIPQERDEERDEDGDINNDLDLGQEGVRNEDDGAEGEERDMNSDPRSVDS